MTYAEKLFITHNSKIIKPYPVESICVQFCVSSDWLWECFIKCSQYFLPFIGRPHALIAQFIVHKLDSGARGQPTHKRNWCDFIDSLILEITNEIMYDNRLIPCARRRRRRFSECWEPQLGCKWGSLESIWAQQVPLCVSPRRTHSHKIQSLRIYTSAACIQFKLLHNISVSCIICV